MATLMENEFQNAGPHFVAFDAKRLPTGVYLCRLQAGPILATRKMVLVR